MKDMEVIGKYINNKGDDSMTTIKAMQEMTNGYAIRKRNWAKGLYIYMDFEGWIRYGSNDNIYGETLNLFDTDWELF